MITQVRPSIPCAPVVREILATAVMDDVRPSDFLTKIATLGARALMPDLLNGQGSGKPYVGVIVPRNPYHRSIRLRLSLDDADVQRIEAVGAAVKRHPREAWYLVLALGWSIHNGTDPDADVAKAVEQRFL